MKCFFIFKRTMKSLTKRPRIIFTRSNNMKICGFTIVRNAIQFRYPVLASIESILPICDEFIVNVGDSQDGTLDLIKSIQSPKIRIIETLWDMNEGPTVLSEQTNI